jgi:branched-subunit amino acid transport protein AzlD
MSKQIIAIVVGALIIFIWQFLSWAMLNIHLEENQYTPNQERILEFLGTQLEDGHYFLPTVPEGTPADEAQAAMEAAVGQPWAKISYHSVMENNMAINMLRGFVGSLVCVILLVWILMRMKDPNFTTALVTSLSVGLIAYLSIKYPEATWYEVPSLGFLLDTGVQWGLVGAWLGWFLNR